MTEKIKYNMVCPAPTKDYVINHGIKIANDLIHAHWNCPDNSNFEENLIKVQAFFNKRIDEILYNFRNVDISRCMYCELYTERFSGLTEGEYYYQCLSIHTPEMYCFMNNPDKCKEFSHITSNQYFDKDESNSLYQRLKRLEDEEKKTKKDRQKRYED